jgi:hypothetical protein
VNNNNNKNKKFQFKKMIMIQTLFFLQVIVVLTTTTIFRIQYTTADILRIAAFDWSGEDNTTKPWSGDNSKAVAVNFFLAEKHWNERRSDIIPALAKVKNCNKNITITSYCDNGARLARSVEDTKWVLDTFNPHGIIGHAILEGTLASAPLAKTYNVPTIEWWTSSGRLSDKNDFPMLLRTIPTDENCADLIFALTQQMSYKRVGILYMTEGADFAAYLLNKYSTVGVDTRLVEFRWQQNININEAMVQMRDTGFKIIIFVAWSGVHPMGADAAKFAGISNDPSYQFIFTTYLSRVPIPEVFAASENMREFFHGALWVRPTVESNSNWATYIKEYVTYDYLVPWMNPRFPPFGQKNSLFYCKDSASDLQIRDDFFSRGTTQLARGPWTYAYDAVLAFGFAACLNNDNGPIPDGKTLIQNAWTLNFIGLSGTFLQFNEHGDRVGDSSGFSLTNFELNRVTNITVTGNVGNWNQGSFSMDEQNIVFRAGKGITYKPADITPPYHEHNYLPLWARAIGYAEILVMNVTAIVSFIWLIMHRQERIVVNGQPEMLHLINIGCLIASWSTFTLSLDDNPDNAGGSSIVGLDVACQASPILFSVGIGLVSSSMTVKSWRIYKLFHNDKLRRMRIDVTRVLSVVILSQTILWVILAAWTGVQPLKWERLVVFADSLGFPQLSHGLCAAPGAASGAFVIVVFGLLLMNLIAAAVGAYAVSTFPTEFQESRWIVIALSSVTQVVFVAIPTTVAVYSTEIGRFMILSSLVFVCVMILDLCMIFPKFYRLSTGKELWAITGDNSTGIVPNNTASPHRRNNNNNNQGGGDSQSMRYGNTPIYSQEKVAVGEIGKVTDASVGDSGG